MDLEIEIKDAWVIFIKAVVMEVMEMIMIIPCIGAKHLES
jgi:hypothetical protein